MNGSYKVVGNSGAVPIHALPFTNELVLFMTRGANYNGTQYSGFLNVGLGTSGMTAWRLQLAVAPRGCSRNSLVLVPN